MKAKLDLLIRFLLGFWITSIVNPIYSGEDIAVAIVASVISVTIWYVIDKSVRKKVQKVSETRQAKTADSKSNRVNENISYKSLYSAPVEEILKDGKSAQLELARLCFKIKDPAIRHKINHIMGLADKIITDVIHDESDIPQVRKFLSYYLPTTIKLLTSYVRMKEQGISGTNIDKSIQDIESMLDTTIKVYERQLDSLFSNQALDVETEIDVLNSMINREGYGDKVFNMQGTEYGYETTRL